MIALEVIGSAFVLAAIGLASFGRYGAMFICNVCAAVIWGAVAVGSGLWGLLGLQVAIAAFAVRGLLKLRGERDAV